MECPKCRQENPAAAQFCNRCHTPLRYTCPACEHVQTQGGKCGQCGVEFAKYAMMLMFQAMTQADKDRELARSRASIIRQIFLFPLTGGLSLVKYFLSRVRGE